MAIRHNDQDIGSKENRNYHIVTKMASLNSGSESVPSFSVFLIHSGWSVLKIYKFLRGYGDVGHIGIVYGKDGSETQRNICILPESSFEKLLADGCNKRTTSRDFSIYRYALNSGNYPEKGHSCKLFIPIEKSKSLDDHLIEKVINSKLRHLAAWKIIPDNSWKIIIPLESRERGELKGGCFIVFQKDVTIHHIAIVKAIINDTYWEEPGVETNSEKISFRCLWARDRKHHSDSPTEPKMEKVKKQIPSQPTIFKKKSAPEEEVNQDQ